MRGVPIELVQAQAKAARLPLWTVPLPWPCSNEIYEQRIPSVVERARSEGVRTFAFGDLLPTDIRAYREQQPAGTGLESLFPIWCTADDTPTLARTMLASGLRATLTCVGPRQLLPDLDRRGFPGPAVTTPTGGGVTYDGRFIAVTNRAVCHSCADDFYVDRQSKTARRAGIERPARIHSQLNLSATTRPPAGVAAAGSGDPRRSSERWSCNL